MPGAVVEAPVQSISEMAIRQAIASGNMRRPSVCIFLGAKVRVQLAPYGFTLAGIQFSAN